MKEPNPIEVEMAVGTLREMVQYFTYNAKFMHGTARFILEEDSKTLYKAIQIAESYVDAAKYG